MDASRQWTPRVNGRLASLDALACACYLKYFLQTIIASADKNFMNALKKDTPNNIHDWIREFIGGRAYIRAMNNRSERNKIYKIEDLVESGAVDLTEARAMLARARDKNQSMDDVIMELERSYSLKNFKSGLNSQKSLNSVATNKTQIPSELQLKIDELEKKVVALHNHLFALEEVTRGLVERAVMDATRIHGIESVVMALAHGSGIGADAEEMYSRTTGEFLNKRKNLLKL